jgi:hypothetical protein
MTRLETILELARWAPSGDNSQPWRFETVSPTHVRVHAFDTRRHCVYDLEGRASQLSVGALLETMRIAATTEGCTLEIQRHLDAPEERPVFDVRLLEGRPVAADPLAAVIRERSVQRRPLSTRALTAAAKRRFEASVASAHRVVWFEGLGGRLRMAWLAARSAKVRLTTPEAYAVHREIIAWDTRFSDERVPDQSLGADALTLRSMRWAMASWPRIERMNRWFGGTIAPRLQLDLLPGVMCGAHFAIVAPRPPTTIDDHLAAGAATQRFWLTATSLGLQLQPQYTPLVFADYARRGVAFTSVAAAAHRARVVDAMLARALGRAAANAAVFLGRVGHGPAAASRSLRLPLERLRWRPEETADLGTSPSPSAPT